MDRRELALEIGRLLRLVPYGELDGVIADAKRRWHQLEAVERAARPQEGQLLELIRTISLPATEVSGFPANALFVRNMSGDTILKIRGVSPEFDQWFGTMDLKAHPASSLGIFHPTKIAYDSECCMALGGLNDSNLCTLSQVWAMLCGPVGSEKVWLVPQHYNEFFVRDGTGAVRVVHLFWDNYGWRIGARELDDNIQACVRVIYVPQS